MGFECIQSDQPQAVIAVSDTWYGKMIRVLWAAFLVALPVTSFPYFPGFMGGDAQVRPLTLYPLIGLLVLVTLPRMVTRKMPHTVIPFLVFGLLASASTALAFTRGFNVPIDVPAPGRMYRTLLTLGIGIGFYFTVSLVPQNRSDLRFTLTWLYVGFGIALLWSTFQILYVIRFDSQYFNFLNQVQSLVSTRRLFDKRVSGMTYEPSWFAEQLTFLLMPLTFASVSTGYSVFRRIFGWLSVEAILLGWSVLALLFTFSRGGLAAFIILLILFLVFMLRGRQKGRQVRWRYWLKLILQISVILVLLGVVIFAVAQKNNYFSRLWGYWTDEESEGTYLYYIAFSQRFTYWETAYRIYEEHPVLGIGLGNYSYYFQDHLPVRQYRSPELLMKLVPEEGRNQIVTVKNFALRILAETGLVGAAAFLAFLVALAGCVLYLLLSEPQENQFWGRAGLLGMFSFIPVTLSIDSFAIPNMWVVFGLITASAFVLREDREGD